MKHHPDCPCCKYARELERARRTVTGLRACRVRDDLIERELKDNGYNQAVIDDALDRTEDLTKPE